MRAIALRTRCLGGTNGGEAEVESTVQYNMICMGESGAFPKQRANFQERLVIWSTLAVTTRRAVDEKVVRP